MAEMKRLAEKDDYEVESELKSSRNKLLSKYVIQSPPKALGSGQVGFLNLGNTCFISAIFQALLCCPELIGYFFAPNFPWTRDLNPLTSVMQGKLAVEFYQLMCEYWSKKSSPDNTIDLTNIHKMIAKVNKQLEDFSQHDAQEFLAFFLDALHEDLNKIIVRRYEPVPDWKGQPRAQYSKILDNLFLKRNKSMIADIFYGQYSSRIQCPTPECGHQSITCEPFNVLSLDMPSTVSVINFDLYFIPFTYDQEIERLSLNCLDSESMESLIASVIQQRPELGGQHIKQMIYRSLTIRDRRPNWQKVTTGSVYYSSSILTFCELANERVSNVLFSGRDPSWLTTDSENQFFLEVDIINNRMFDGIQRQVLVPRDITRFEISLLVYMIHRQAFINAGFFPRSINVDDFPALPKDVEELIQDFSNFKSFAEKKGLPNLFEIMISDGGKELMCNTNFFDKSRTNIILVQVYFNSKQSEPAPNFRKVKPVTLTDMPYEHTVVSLKSCLENFIKPEVLDHDNMWYCSKCKEHKKATKDMAISRLPKVLIFHFKRFKKIYPDQSIFRKFQDQITFDLNGLDMSPYIETKPQNEIMYDLFAVCNHFGNVSNGHYIAVCQNPSSGEWTTFDDRFVRPTKAEDVSTKNAYLLFYKKRQ